MLMMTERNSFDVAAFDDEASLVEDVSMLLMLNRESVDEANDADLI